MTVLDTHLHTRYSLDGYLELTTLCSAAADAGMNAIALTDHVECERPVADWPDFQARLSELNDIRSALGERLTVFDGVELGQPWYHEAAAKRLLETHPFDFVIGSVHMVTGYGDFSTYDFENGDADALLRAYLDDNLRLAEAYDFDTLAHLTYPFRYLTDEQRGRYPIERYAAQYERILKTLIERGRSLELNTSEYRTRLAPSLPLLTLLRWYYALGGRSVTIGSDGHSLKSAFQNLDRGREALAEIGFTKLTCYSKRKAMYTSL